MRTQGIDFSGLRTELHVPDTFPQDVTAAAEQAARSPRETGADRTALPLVTIDPPGSTDLDQAVHLARTAGGYRVSYAIADVAAFVSAGDVIDAEARLRGQTLYSPDTSTLLYPAALSQQAASLLPDQSRPAALWELDLDERGELVGTSVRRAVVRSVARLDYAGVQRDLDTGRAHPSIELLGEIGALRRGLSRRRGALELDLPEQEVVPTGEGWSLSLRSTMPTEQWNAEISLLTGIAAARLMLAAGIGLLRTLPEPGQHDIDFVRRAAMGLHISWPAGARPADVLATVDGGTPRGAAFFDVAASMLRGAGYTAFDGSPPGVTAHAGVGAPYAHVTAPLRRLADRYVTEVCLALSAGTAVPEWARNALPGLPEVMTGSGRRAHELERACIDLTEATLLANRVGERFDAAVVDSGREHGTVALDDPAVRARCDGDRLELGERITVVLQTADPATRTIRFRAG